MADDAWLISRCAPAVDRNVGETAQLTDEVFDVRASTSIDLRRIFTREHGDSRRCHHRQFGIRSGAPSGHVGEGEGDGDVEPEGDPDGEPDGDAEGDGDGDGDGLGEGDAAEPACPSRPGPTGSGGAGGVAREMRTRITRAIAPTAADIATVPPPVAGQAPVLCAELR